MRSIKSDQSMARQSFGSTLFADPQHQVVVSAHHSDLGDDSAAMRTMPAGFMVFTDKSETKSHRSDTVYNCFAHVGSDKTTPVEKKISLLGVCSDTTPYSKSKHSRVGVSIAGALPIVMNRDDLKGLYPGDLIDYRFEMTPLEFSGLPHDFRTARVKKRGAYVGPFMAHHSISDLRRMFDNVENKRKVAEEILKKVSQKSIKEYYKILGRKMPKSDNSVDWIRDMLGAGLYGPTNFDHWWSLHKVEMDKGKPKVVMRTKPTPYYMGWLNDAYSAAPRKTSISPLISDTQSNEEYWATQVELSQRFDNANDKNPISLVPEGSQPAIVGDGDSKLQEIFGNVQASMLESVLCDGRCGHLGKIVEISTGDEALVLLENPV